jgi:hypothetical protein
MIVQTHLFKIFIFVGQFTFFQSLLSWLCQLIQLLKNMLLVIFLSLTSCTFFSFCNKLNNHIINELILLTFFKFFIHVIFNTNYFIIFKYFTIISLFIIFGCSHDYPIYTGSGIEGVNLTIILRRYF